VARVKVELRAIVPEPPWETSTPLERRREGRLVVIRLPQPEEFLRRQIELRVRTRSDEPVQTFRIRTERPSPLAAFAGDAAVPVR
jgi:hypothetical protein